MYGVVRLFRACIAGAVFTPCKDRHIITLPQRSPAHPQQLSHDTDAIIDELHRAHISGPPVQLMVRRSPLRPAAATLSSDEKLFDGDDDSFLEEDKDDQDDDDDDDDDGDGWRM